MKATPISLNTPCTKDVIHATLSYVRYECPGCKSQDSVRICDHDMRFKSGDVYALEFCCPKCEADLELEFAVEATEVALRLTVLGLMS